MSRLLLLNWRATLEVGPISIPSSVPIIIPASERDLSIEKIYSDWLFIQVGMKEAHIILITEWLVLFCGINKKITANGEVITNL